MTMLINKFCEMYGVDKYVVDYWTRIGLLHPKIDEHGYRDYDIQTEQEIQMILVAKMLDYPGSLESKVERLHEMDEEQWQKVLSKLQNNYNRFTRNYSAAYKIASNKSQGGA